MHCTFSPSTINQRLVAIRKLATEAQRCGYVDSEMAQAIVSSISDSRRRHVAECHRLANGANGTRNGVHLSLGVRGAFAGSSQQGSEHRAQLGLGSGW
jgi:hypothetical protein